METTKETPQTSKTASAIKVTKEQVLCLLEVFKAFGVGDFETIAYRLKEIAFCVGQCDKGTNDLKHLLETLQDIDNILGFILVDELKGIITKVNQTDDFTRTEIQITD